MAFYDKTGHRISCFGYIDGRFYGGIRHHMGIMQFVLSHGYDFESLMNARQAWGWIMSDHSQYDDQENQKVLFRLSTDAGAIDPTLEPAISHAITEITGWPAEVTTIEKPTNEEYAPDYGDMYEEGYYQDDPLEGVYIYDSRTGWQGWVNTSSSEQFPPSAKEPEQLSLFDHPEPGGGNPPPKLTAWREDMWKESRNKFVYDSKTGELNATDDWKSHHGDLLEGLLGDTGLAEAYEEGYADDPNRFVYGEHYSDEEPFIYHTDKLPPHVVNAAYEAYMQWLEQNHFLAHRKNSVGDLPEHYALMGPERYTWLIDWKGNLKISDSGQHHADLGWAGDEIATGDVIVGEDPYTGAKTPGQNTIRLLSYDWNYDPVECLHRAWDAWDDQHPDLQITKREFRAPEPTDDEWQEDEGLTNYASFDIIGGMKTSMAQPINAPDNLLDPEGNTWELYQMESGEYKNHHAVMVDNKNRRLYLNYHGHHAPLLDAAAAYGIPYESFFNTVQGHYRLEPSQDEPFGEGWGFHHGELTPWQEAVMAEALRNYHSVDDLEQAWIGHKEATYLWVPTCSKAANSKKWKALYNRDDATLFIWQTCGDESHHVAFLQEAFGEDKFFKNGNVKKSGGFTQAEGLYTTVSFILPTGAKDIEAEKKKVRDLLDKALTAKWPTVEKETHFKPIPLRFMVTKNGSVYMGDHSSHYDLICDYISKEAAEEYKNYNFSTEYPFIAGGFINDYGIIRLVHTHGEGEYDPKFIASLVFDEALDNGESVTGHVIYEDWRSDEKKIQQFDLI